MPTNRVDGVACDDCGTGIEIGDSCYLRNGYTVCYACMESRDSDDSENEDEESAYSGVQHYGYHPENKFHHANGTVSSRPKKFLCDASATMFNLPYMGAELEAEAPSDTYLRDWASKVVDETNGLIYPKEDCTIHHGFEMVTHPMDLAYVQNHTTGWSNVLGDMRKAGWRAWDSSNCGFHIHLEKKSFINPKHELKFIYFIFKNKINMIKFAGRNSTYARFDLESFINVNHDTWYNNKPNLMEIVKGVQKNGRYVPSPAERNLAVNRLPDNTHELRFFKPSLRYSTVLSYFEFTHCLWAFTKDVTTEQVMKENALTSFSLFADFARSNKNTYPNFVERMHKRKLSSKPDLWDDTNDSK